MNPANHITMTSIWIYLQSWPWWLGGLGLGLTAVGLAWFTGRRLGVTGGFEDACSIVTLDESSYAVSPFRWKMWFILGLPLGGLISNLVSNGIHLNWTLLFGRLDAFTFGNSFGKVVWLFMGGLLIGFGARWAGGCTSGHSIMGVSLGNKMSILATVAFLTAGILLTNLLMKVM